MISEATARRRTLIALAACVPMAALLSFAWVRLMYPSFCGGAYSDFKMYPHVLFLPATLVAFVFGASDAGLRTALFCEAFVICFAAIAFAYFLVAYLYRREPA